MVIIRMRSHPRFGSVLICFLGLVLIYVGVSGTRSSGHICLRRGSWGNHVAAKSGPVVTAEEVRVVDNAIGNEKNLCIHKFPELPWRQWIRCDVTSISSKALSFDGNDLGFVVGRDHAHYDNDVRFWVIKGRLLAILDLLNNKVCRNFSSGRSLAVVHDFNIAANGYECLSGGRREREFNPGALIFPHRIELRSHDNELVDGGSRQYESERSDAPVSKGLVLFGPLVESPPPRWFLACAGLTCSLLGGFLFVIGYFLVFHEKCFLGGFFFFLSSSLSFALVFAFAHWAYGKISVTQKDLTVMTSCNTVIDMANVLNTDKQIAVIGALAEGSSIRSIERITGVHRDTIMRLGVKVGQGCATLLDAKMRDLSCRRLEFDEIWGFIGKKARHVRPDDDPQFGDVWTFCAIDAETKLVPSFKVGKRDLATAKVFVGDVASRMRNRVQISSDVLRAYVDAIEQTFGTEVDFAQIVKTYEHDESQHPGRKYSAPEFVSVEKRAVTGRPDMDLVSTSYIERLNATTRLHMRRLTRLTLAFSKKLDNFEAAVALHFAYYNLVKRHGTLRCTPAMAAGVEHSFWTVGDLVEAVAQN